MSTPTRIFDRLLEIALLFDADLARSFAGTALTTSRTHLLWVLHRVGPSTQRALAKALQVSPRNVTGLVDALEAAGYVERRPHPSDRRALLVTLTEQGERDDGRHGARPGPDRRGAGRRASAADRLDELDRSLARSPNGCSAWSTRASRRLGGDGMTAVVSRARRRTWWQLVGYLAKRATLAEFHGYRSIYRFVFRRPKVPAGAIGLQLPPADPGHPDRVHRRLGRGAGRGRPDRASLGLHPDPAARPQHLGHRLDARPALRHAHPTPCRRAGRHPSPLRRRGRHRDRLAVGRCGRHPEAAPCGEGSRRSP